MPEDGWIRTRAGWRFRRLDNATVRIEIDLRDRSGHTERTVETELPAGEWIQVVAGLAADPFSEASQKTARTLHKGSRRAAST